MDEFQRLYARHVGALTFDAHWISMVLIGPKWQADFLELCDYLDKSVRSIVSDYPTKKNPFSHIDNYSID